MSGRWLQKNIVGVKIPKKFVSCVSRAIRINPGALRPKNPQKWPFGGDPKNSMSMRFPKKLNFAKQKNGVFLNLFIGPEIDFEQDTTFYGEINFWPRNFKKGPKTRLKKMKIA